MTDNNQKVLLLKTNKTNLKFDDKVKAKDLSQQDVLQMLLVKKSKILLEQEEFLDTLSVINSDKKSEASFSKMVEELNQEVDKKLIIRLLNRNYHLLKKIDNTVSRINNDDYGNCSECSIKIDDQRLAARPLADKCITCKEEEENVQKKVFFLKRSKTLGEDNYFR
jgi:DnaK suppressor protein